MAGPIENLKPWKPGQTGNPGGKPVGARNKLTTLFLTVLVNDFEKHGEAAIVKCREERPEAYIKAIAALMPKEVEFKNPLGDMDDGQLIAAIAALQSFVAAGGVGAGTAQAPKPN